MDRLSPMPFSGAQFWEAAVAEDSEAQAEDSEEAALEEASEAVPSGVEEPAAPGSIILPPLLRKL